MTKIINIFGGPGVGKSSLASEVFVQLKHRNVNVEIVFEYAKDMVWENRHEILDEQI